MSDETRTVIKASEEDHRLAAIRDLMDARFREQERLMDERDKRYQREFDALAELSNTRFESAKEAVNKALAAQEGVNIRQNEFRGQLSDQASMLMPRKETETLISGLRDSVGRVTDEVQRQMETAREGNRLLYDGLRSENAVLQKAQSEIKGRERQGVVGSENAKWLVQTLISLVSAAIGAGLVISFRG